jgi:hypothetical protein
MNFFHPDPRKHRPPMRLLTREDEKQRQPEERAMRSLVILTATVAGLSLGAVPAQAYQTCDLVQSWYARYLGRPADGPSLAMWVNQLQAGVPADQVQATILGSNEYYQRHGSCPQQFVAGLYADILGRQPCAHDINGWVARLGQCGCRNTLAAKFLCAAQYELALRAAPPVYSPPPTFAPGPSYAPPAPSYVPPAPAYPSAPAYPPAPGYAPPAPAYSPAPVYVPQQTVYQPVPVTVPVPVYVSRPGHHCHRQPLPPRGVAIGVRYRSGW